MRSDLCHPAIEGSAHERKSGPPRVLLFRSSGPPASALGQCADPRARRRQASTRRLTPRRSTMRSSSRPTASSPRSAAAATCKFPSDARVIDCTGKTVVAGFWNSHVHFTQAVWKNAGTRRPRRWSAYAGHADPMGLHHRMGSRLRPASYLAVARASTPARSRVPTFCLPAASSPRTAIPSICRPRWKFPKRRRRMKRRNGAQFHRNGP